MKKQYIFSLFLTFSSVVSAQDSVYSKVYYNSIGYKLEALAVDPTSHVVQVGSTDFDYAAFTYLDSLGNILSSNKYLIDGQSANGFTFTDVVATSGNEFYVSGGALLQGFGANVGIVAKLDNQGAVIWSKGVYTPAPGFFKCTDIIESAEQTLWIVGSDDQTGETAIIEFDTDGTQLSAFSFKINGDRLEVLDIKEMGDTLVFTGSVFSNSGSSKGIVFTTDKNGTFLWSNTLNDTKLFETELNENSIWAAGHTSTMNPFIASLSHDGSFRSMSSFDPISDIEDLDLANIHDSTLAITMGNFYQSNLIVTRVNSTDLDYFSVFNNATEVVSRENNGFYIGGYGPNYGIKSSWLPNPHSNMMRADSSLNMGDCISSGWNNAITSSTPIDSPMTLVTLTPAALNDLAISPIENILTDFVGCVDYYSGLNELNESLITIFPNPANGQVQVANPKGLKGSLEIQNASGETVYRTKISTMEQSLDLNHLPAGIYFFQFKNQADNTQMSFGKLTIL